MRPLREGQRKPFAGLEESGCHIKERLVRGSKGCEQSPGDSQQEQGSLLAPSSKGCEQFPGDSQQEQGPLSYNLQENEGSGSTDELRRGS